MNPFIVFILGCVGALAPEIVRLYSLRNNSEQFTWSSFYLIVSFIFALLGGLVALVLPATTFWGALYVGISTPVLVNTALKKGLEQQKVELKSGLQNEGKKQPMLRSFVNGL
jgi:hypothetical protein